MEKRRTKRHVEDSFPSQLNFDHVLFWYRKKNVHSGPIYVNSPCLSHLTYSEKSKFQENQTTQVRDHEGLHQALILKLGNYNQVKAAECRVEEMAEAGFTTDTIMEKLAEAEDLDEAAGDEDENDDCSLPQPVLPNAPRVFQVSGLMHNEQSRLEKEQQKSKDLASAYLDADEDNGSDEDGDSPITIHRSSKRAKTLVVVEKKTPNQAKASSSKEVEVEGLSSECPTPRNVKNVSLEKSKQQNSPSVTVSASQLLLLESRVQTGLLKQMVREQQEQTSLLREFLSPRENVNREDKVVVGNDGKEFRLSQLPNAPTFFARELVLRKFGQEYCVNAIIEPKGQTRRVQMDSTAIEEIKNCLNLWCPTYSWITVRASLNQFFRDMANKLKKQSIQV